ncbi:MAG: NAD(+)/NADH kinase [Oscillospiraceae bacterium]|nr:NAD(+)/NADH kinase [Oscillospiraceae bacterium]
MKRIILCVNPGRDRNFVLTRQLYRGLLEMGKNPVVCVFGGDAQDTEHPADMVSGELRDIVHEAELVITLGGDGTLLHAARAAADWDVPLLGVNLGRVGFLAELTAGDANQIYEAVRGNYTLEKRMMLDVELWRNGKLLYRNYALNDAVIGGMARILRLSISGDGKRITEYSGDGVVLATPTGSTAYSLAAGGPLVEPEAENIIITPICAHTLAARAYVLAPDRQVKVEILRAGEKAAYLSCDGGECLLLESGDVLKVSRSALTTSLVRMTDRIFYEKISQKLGESK